MTLDNHIHNTNVRITAFIFLCVCMKNYPFKTRKYNTAETNDFCLLLFPGLSGVVIVAIAVSLLAAIALIIVIITITVCCIKHGEIIIVIIL